MRLRHLLLTAATLSLVTLSTMAQEAQIRQNLKARFPRFPTINEVTKTPMDNLYEVRLNDSDILYTDAQANFLIRGELIDARAKTNLTSERISKLSAVDFDKLPFKGAFTIVHGNGKNKIAVFADPNCGYCKLLEKNLQAVNNVTIYLFLYPVLGEDSVTKSNSIWCAKDKSKTWLDLMLRNKQPAAATCDVSAVTANMKFGQAQKIKSTPTIFFANGVRIEGALPVEQLEAAIEQNK